ncbi:MAG: hypothetical protein II098_01805 [Treponema sp.]|nr:hypothetical protein [Treponema sp.]
MKKQISLLATAGVMVAVLSISLASCKQSEDVTNIINLNNNVAESKTKTFDVVVEELTSRTVDLADSSTTITLGFRQGKEDIPYVNLTSEFLKAHLDHNFGISEINAGTKSVTITNKDRNNTTAEFDLTTHALIFKNYDLFFQKSSKVYMDPSDVEQIAKDAGEEKTYLEITDFSNIAGQSVALDWSTQDIGVILCKNADGSYDLAIPLQMFNDVFLSPSGDHFVYNGNKVFKTESLGKESIKNEYYDSSYSGKKRSEAMAKFCYDELCLNFDFNYGLKEIHGIEKFLDFDNYFANAGIKNDLMSTDPATFANALKDVCEFYFGDGHSNYIRNSPYLGSDASIIKGNHTFTQRIKLKGEFAKYKNARDSVYSGGDLPGYELSLDGKTAIVRFDEFSLNESALSKSARKNFGDKLISDDLLKKYVNYSDANKTQHTYESTYDTVAFIYAINRTIKEYDAAHPEAKIENIVLDMSCNGGGANHSACFVLAWMLGSCTFDFTNPITGAKWSISYKADVDMNGTAGEDSDTVKDKNLFCLISPCSFSCGNMVPAMLKASNRVTILGVTSGGGSSCVQMSSAADGTIFRMSSKNVMSINKNGSNYDIDKGVDPHYYINAPEKFYSISIINNLVKNINSGTLNVN